MDYKLSEEQRLLQESARRMSDAEITPRLRAHRSDAPLPKSVMLEIYAVLAREGLTAPRLSHEDGGAAMTMLDYGIVFENVPVIAISLISHECTIARINAESRSPAARELLPYLIAGRRNVHGEHRAGHRVRSARNRHARDGGRRPSRRQRTQDVDHQRQHQRRYDRPARRVGTAAASASCAAC